MLNPQQLSQLKATTGSSSGVSPTQAMTPEQAHSWIRGTPTSLPDQSTDKVTGQPLDSLSKFVQGSVGGAFNSGVDQVKQGYQDATKATNPLSKTEAGMKMLAGGVGAALSPIAPVLAPVGAGVQEAGDRLSETPLIKGAAGNTTIGAHGETNYVPNQGANRVTEDINNTANVLPLGAGIAVPGEIAGIARGAVKGAQDTVGGAADNIKAAVTPKPVTPEATAASTASKLKGVATDWQKPTETPSASFNNARAVLAKDPTTPQFLAEQKLSPQAHITDGKYDTADTAQGLRDTAGKMSGDTLRPSLQMADYSTPKGMVSDIIDQAIKNANADKSLTPGERAVVIRNITKEGAALSKENPDGLSLTDSHDSKITYAGSAGYSPIKSAADNAVATANRHIASALQKDVETRAPAGVPVKAFNAYLVRYYKAADYLDALNTKKVPTTLLQNVMHRGAQVMGAVVGHGVGGGILGGVGGYVIGGALEHALENLTTPMRASFLSNLEITNPEAFTKVQDYLKAQNTGENGMLRLPAATNETPIPMNAPVPPKSPVAIPATKMLPTANPKTGRMQTTYSSTPR